MGSWGNKPFQNDADSDWQLLFNRGLAKELEKSIKQTEFRSETRAAIEYLVRLHKAGLYHFGASDPLLPLSMYRARDIEEEFGDIDNYDWWFDTTTQEEKMEVVRANRDSVRRQIRYLDKVAEDIPEIKKDSKSYKELEDAYAKLKNRVQDRRSKNARPVKEKK